MKFCAITSVNKNFSGGTHRRGTHTYPPSNRKKENRLREWVRVKLAILAFIFQTKAMLVSYYKTYSVRFKPLKHDYTIVLTETLTDWSRKCANSIISTMKNTIYIFSEHSLIAYVRKRTCIQAVNAVSCN